MLVSFVCLHLPRTIAVSIAEKVTAADLLAPQSSVFTTLVDDPVSSTDTIDAYIGEIMEEAASAADSVSAGSDYSGAIDEAATATDTQDSTSAAIPTRSAMVAGPVFVNPSTSRQANVNGTMVNL